MRKPVCKVSDIIFVRFLLTDLEIQKKYLSHFGMFLAHETEDSIFFRGTGKSPYCYVATKSHVNRYVGSAYSVNSYSDLEALAEDQAVPIIQNQEPGGGYKVTIIDPDEIEIEVYHGMNLVEPIQSEEIILNSGNQKLRKNKLQRLGRAADEWQLNDGKWIYELSSKVKRLGHTAINVKNAEQSIEWYANKLGFLVSDNMIGPDGNESIGAFMRCDQGDLPVDHHTLNNVQFLSPDAIQNVYGHAGYEVTGSVDDLMAGHFHLKTIDQYKHEWGIGRHLLGSQMYDYWRDPYGFTHEHWTDGDLLDASIPPLDSQARDIIMAQYGPEVPSSFGQTMPVEELDRYRQNVTGLSDIIKELEIQQLPDQSSEK
tara:strand:- start:704 stop:1813 length:1110 start_codon:yes stop_codon:yes gene_type:complete